MCFCLLCSVQAIYPSPDPASLLDKRIMSLVQYARKVEGDMYEMANSRVSKHFDVLLQWYRKTIVCAVKLEPWCKAFKDSRKRNGFRHHRHDTMQPGKGYCVCSAKYQSHLAQLRMGVVGWRMFLPLNSIISRSDYFTLHITRRAGVQNGETTGRVFCCRNSEDLSMLMYRRGKPWCICLTLFTLYC